MSSQQALQQKYNSYQSTITEINQKLNELKSDQDEHNIVLKTLESTPDDRRCFRMIGGVLVEKNVGETKPVLQLKVSKISETIVLLNKELHSLLDEFEKWKVSLV